MLAAAAETEPGEEQLLALTLESQRMWPGFARELEAAAATSIGYRDEGTIVVALTRDDAEQLRFTYDFQRSLGLELEWLSGAEARRREPHLRARHFRARCSAPEIIRSKTAGSSRLSPKPRSRPAPLCTNFAR